MLSQFVQSVTEVICSASAKEGNLKSRKRILLAWGAVLLVSLTLPLPAEVIVLKAKDVDQADNVWKKRGDAGKDSWGIVGNHKVTSGEMKFDSFPGPSGKYRVEFGVVLEEDGRPKYRISIGEEVLKEDRYPWPDGKNRCQGKGSKAHVIQLGEHQIEKGSSVTIWGESTYECSKDHGAYTRWYEVRFIPISLDQKDDSPPSAPKNIQVTNRQASSVQLAWDPSQDAESEITHYVVERDGKEVGESSENRYTEVRLLPDTEYTFIIYAVNQAGLRSEKSVATKVKTENAEVQPIYQVSLQGDVSVGESVVIEWKVDSSLVNDVIIRVSPDRGNSWSLITGETAVNINDPAWGHFRWKIPCEIAVQGNRVPMKEVSHLLFEVYQYTDTDVKAQSEAVELGVKGGACEGSSTQIPLRTSSEGIAKWNRGWFQYGKQGWSLLGRQ